MDRKDLATSANNSQKTAPADPERTMVASAALFDEEAVQHARPAQPLVPSYRRSWPLAIALMVTVAGLIGGVIGGLVTAIYQRPANVSTASQTAALRETPATQPETAATDDETPAHNEQGTQQSLPETTRTENPPAEIRKPEADVAENASVPARAATGDRLEQRSEMEQRSERPAARQLKAREQIMARESADEEEMPSAQAPQAAQQSLRGALDEWIAATNARDIDRQMKFYGQSMNAFYLSRNASREAVRAEKRRVFGAADNVDVRAAAPEIKLSPDATTATMLFRKRYQIGQNRRGEVLQELRWRRTKQGWRIVSERDLKVLNE